MKKKKKPAPEPTLCTEPHEIEFLEREGVAWCRNCNLTGTARYPQEREVGESFSANRLPRKNRASSY